MSGEKRDYLNNRMFIISFIIIIAGWIIKANRESNATQEVIVTAGEDLILDCNLSKYITIRYPVHWKTGSEFIGIPYPKVYQEPPIYNASLHQKHFVTYGNHSGSWLFTLMISDVNLSDAGEYTCVDSTVRTPNQLQSFDVSVVTCQCSTPVGVEDLTGNERITLNCILQGYQPQHDGKTAVSITLDSGSIDGHFQDNVLTTDMEVRNFCQDTFLQIHSIKKTLFSSPIQCQIPRLDPCPFIKSTAKVRQHPTTTAVQVPILQTKEQIKTYRPSLPFYTGTTRMQYHTLSPLSTIIMEGPNSIQDNSSLSFTIAATKSMMFSSSTSSTRNLIFISTSISIAFAATIGILFIVCFLQWRNDRHNGSPGCKSGTKDEGKEENLGSSLYAECDYSVETSKGTDKKMTPAVKAHYANVQESNEASKEGEYSNIDLILNTYYEVSIAPTAMQPSATSQISKDIDAGSLSPPITHYTIPRSLVPPASSTNLYGI